MTPYYILAVAFGAFATVLFLVGHKKPGDFPGKLYAPIILTAVVFAGATMTAVIVGSAAHSDESHEPAAAHEEGSDDPAGDEAAH